MSSGSDSESDRSASPANNGPAPTPGHGLERSPSNSPQYKPEDNTDRGGSRSRSASAGSHSRSPSAESNKSVGSAKHSGSAASSRSSSPASKRSGSAASNRSRSGSPVSNRSRSKSAGSNRSKSHSKSPASNRSRSKSAESNRSRSRSSSAASNRSRRSRSGSRSGVSNRSRSGSAASNRSRSKSGSRSRSKSAGSNRSGASRRSRSGSAASNRSRSKSGSRSRSGSREGGNRSGTHSPNLQIDEPENQINKRERSGSDDDEDTVGVKKKKKVIASDSEGEADGGGGGGGGGDVSATGECEDGKVDAAAIFGDDADDISSEEEKDEEKKDQESAIERRSGDEEEHKSDDEDVERVGDEEEKENNEPEPIPETRIDVEVPKITCDLGRDIHFVKLPNFLSVETRPFDPETYEDEIDEEETLDEEGRARLKLKVENTIRWRDHMDKEGNIIKQSNARLVRWSDGSYSLHLGSEIFDVYRQPLQGDHHHLFIRQGTGLQGQAVFRTKLSFRPHSTDSFTHKKMTRSLADRSQKTSGIKILSQVGLDPDHDRKELLKKEEEKLRQTVRSIKPRKKDTSARIHANSNAYREDEGSEEEGAISLNAIKNKYKSAAAAVAKGGAIYSSDEDGSDIEARRGKKTDKTKALKTLDSSEESE